MAVIVFSISSGCSGSSAESAGNDGGGARVDCETFCNKALAANCPADDRTTCGGECEQSFTRYEKQCPSQTNDLFSCVLSNVPFICYDNGQAIPDPQQEMAVCSEELAVFQSCSACIPDETDCHDVCNKTKCCSELTAYVTDPSRIDFQNCVISCSATGDPQTCGTDCENQFPDLKAKGDAYSSCQIQNCASC